MRILLLLIVAGWITPAARGAPQAEPRGLRVIVVSREADAADLRARIQAGASFEALAREHSRDSSASSGGYLGAVIAEDLTPELRRALAGLRPGDISPVARVGNEFYLLQWVPLGEDSWRNQTNAGIQAFQQGRYPEAAQSFAAALLEAEKFGPDDDRLAHTLNSLALMYKLQGKNRESEPLFRRSLAIFEKNLGLAHPNVIQNLDDLAAVNFELENYTESERLYRRILSIRWAGPQVLDSFAAVLSLAFFKDAELDKSLDAFRHAIEPAQTNVNLYIAMSDGLHSLELPEEAEAVMLRAVEAFPDSRQVRHETAEGYVQSRKLQRAIEVFEEALRLKGSSDPSADLIQRSAIYARIASMNSELNRFDAAIAAYEKALELTPDNVESRVALGDLYLQRGSLDEAMSEYARVISTHSDNAAAHHGIAAVDLRLGHFPESVAEVEKALKIDPKRQESLYVRATAMIRAGRSDEGQKLLEEYQKLAADARAQTEAKRTVGVLLRSAASNLVEGRQEESLALLREGIGSHPDSALLYMELGLAQAKLGQPRAAADTFQKMIDLGFGDDFMVHRNLSLAYASLGDTKASQKHRVIYVQKYDAALKEGFK